MHIAKGYADIEAFHLSSIVPREPPPQIFPFVVHPQLGDGRLERLQSLMWRRSADQVTALPEEGHLPEGRGGGPLPVPHHLSGADPALPHPGLPARVEHWVLVSGGFTVAVEKCEGHGFRCPA